MKRLVILTLLTFAILPWAMADQKIDLTRPADPEGEISIEFGAGKLRIIGWARNEIQIVGTVPDGEDMFELEAEDGEINIEVALPEAEDRNYVKGDHDRHHRRDQHSFSDDEADLEIHIPRDSELEIEGISTELSIDDVRGSVSVESISGTVNLNGSLKEFEITVVSGNINVVNRSDLRDGEVEAVSGNVDIKTGLSSEASLDIESISGAVTLRLPSDTKAEFTVETFSGSIRSDFGSKSKKSSFLPSESLHFNTGQSRDAEINISAFSGTIRLIKED